MSSNTHVIPKHERPQPFNFFSFHGPPCHPAGSGHAAVVWLAVEACIVVTQAAARRGFEVAESFLGTLLGNRRWTVEGGGWQVDI